MADDVADDLADVGIGAILLAAGESSRMGEPKQLLDWRGLPLLEYQIRALQQTTVDDIVVVLGHRADEFLAIADRVMEVPRARAITNPRYAEGKTTSVKAGLKSLKRDVGGVILLAVDQPRPAEVLQTLIDGHIANDSRISVPSYRGRCGHPPLFHGSLLAELLEITEERQGIREVIQRHTNEVRLVEVVSAVTLTNLNTPEDYRRARHATGSE